MDAKNCLILLTGFMLFASFSAGEDEDLKTNLGDVRLFNVEHDDSNEVFSGEAQIYITDGNSPKNWSRICKTHSFNYEESQVFCQQLGYSGGVLAEQKAGSNYPMKISNFECGRSGHLHMLRCAYTIDNYSCPGSVFIQCSSVKADISRVNGQLKICSPDSNGNNSNPSIVASVSFGIISISFDNDWKAIGNSSLSLGVTNLADLMCYTMGFQKSVSGSVMTSKAVEKYSFSTCNNEILVDSSWVNLTQLDCDISLPYPCFGCCLRYPYHQACSKSRCTDDFIVLRCMFDPYDKETKANPQNCTFRNKPSELERINNYGNMCDLSAADDDVVWKVMIGLLTVTIAILIIINFLPCFIQKCIITRKREQYESINQPTGQD